MNPGRELDALVAEKVMGLAIETRWRTTGKPPFIDIVDYPVIVPEKGANNFGKDIPHYSTDIAAAWEVVEHIGNRFQVFITSRGRSTDVDLVHWPDNLKGHFSATGDTAAHAICLAALKSCGIVAISWRTPE